MPIIRKHTLKKEISVILLVKVLAIFLIWLLCFSNPIAKHLTVHRMQAKILGSTQIEGNHNG
ncbi:MAG: hypothetical protein K0U12_06065 [Gammaproteobacteria bacterium]|nr:hypothetical protein [Gammaproteobacteria bacterium]